MGILPSAVIIMLSIICIYIIIVSLLLVCVSFVGGSERFDQKRDYFMRELHNHHRHSSRTTIDLHVARSPNLLENVRFQFTSVTIKDAVCCISFTAM